MVRACLEVLLIKTLRVNLCFWSLGKKHFKNENSHIVTHVCWNLSTWEGEAGGLPRVWYQYKCCIVNSRPAWAAEWDLVSRNNNNRTEKFLYVYIRTQGWQTVIHLRSYVFCIWATIQEYPSGVFWIATPQTESQLKNGSKLAVLVLYGEAQCWEMILRPQAVGGDKQVLWAERLLEASQACLVNPRQIDALGYPRVPVIQQKSEPPFFEFTGFRG